MLKKLAAAALLLGTMAVVAEAACPAGTKYMCYPGSNGKQLCGCY